ncbi:MAG TPA: prepilin-type N-terminal cleavage/methylation domain-containing protein [Mycobacteriales bacterium]|jgi:type IV pilus assembly protein PilA|nr:prepilin-type N-terminal cleavage/methylation domain-containing protein [Mycobacteriales bacterium]
MDGGATRDEGFTLIELLVVIVVLAVLAAIAIPNFLAQRDKAHRTSAVSDMKHAALAIESWAVDHEGSYAGLNGATQDTPALTDEGFRSTDWVSVTVSATHDSYCIRGTNERLPGKEFVFRNADGVVEMGSPGAIPC